LRTAVDVHELELVYEDVDALGDDAHGNACPGSSSSS
jgi:hypothetical protein